MEQDGAGVGVGEKIVRATFVTFLLLSKSEC